MSCTFHDHEIEQELEAIECDINSIRDRMADLPAVPEPMTEELERLRQRREDLQLVLDTRRD